MVKRGRKDIPVDGDGTWYFSDEADFVESGISL